MFHPFTLCLAAVALLLAGCSHSTLTSSKNLVRPGALPGDAPSLAVVPFENLSNHRHAGLAITDLATTALYAQHRFRILEVSSLGDNKDARLRRLEIAPWERQVGANTDNALAAARLLKADYALAGSVGEYGFVDGFGETANVAVNLRLVRVSDGQVIWAGSLSRLVNTWAFHEESVHRLAHAVLLDLTRRMDRETWGKCGIDCCGQECSHDSVKGAPPTEHGVQSLGR